MGVVAIRPELAIQRNVGVVVVLVICERGGRRVGILLGLQLAREVLTCVNAVVKVFQRNSAEGSVTHTTRAQWRIAK